MTILINHFSYATKQLDPKANSMQLRQSFYLAYLTQ
jgi:hypothetical protein